MKALVYCSENPCFASEWMQETLDVLLTNQKLLLEQGFRVNGEALAFGTEVDSMTGSIDGDMKEKIDFANLVFGDYRDDNLQAIAVIDRAVETMSMQLDLCRTCKGLGACAMGNEL